MPANDERTKHILGHLNKTTGDKVSVGLIDSDGGCKGKAIVLQRQNGGIRLVPKQNTSTASSSSEKLKKSTIFGPIGRAATKQQIDADRYFMMAIVFLPAPICRLAYCSQQRE